MKLYMCIHKLLKGIIPTIFTFITTNPVHIDFLTDQFNPAQSGSLPTKWTLRGIQFPTRTGRISQLPLACKTLVCTAAQLSRYEWVKVCAWWAPICVLVCTCACVHACMCTLQKCGVGGIDAIMTLTPNYSLSLSTSLSLSLSKT